MQPHPAEVYGQPRKQGPKVVRALAGMFILGCLLFIAFALLKAATDSAAEPPLPREPDSPQLPAHVKQEPPKGTAVIPERKSVVDDYTERQHAYGAKMEENARRRQEAEAKTPFPGITKGPLTGYYDHNRGGMVWGNYVYDERGKQLYFEETSSHR